MYILKSQTYSVTVDYENGCVSSLIIGGKERIIEKLQLFNIGVRNKKGELFTLKATDAHERETKCGNATYTDFVGFNKDITVSVELKNVENETEWYISVYNNCEDILIEWVDFPLINLPMLKDNNDSGMGGEILFPFNEGCIVSDIKCREERAFNYQEPEYPSKGSFSVFPNMLCSQMSAYLWDDCGLYIGAHDPDRGIKAIDFYEYGKGITMQTRIYSGISYGEDFVPDYPVVWTIIGSNWESAAERYRQWFENTLPEGVRKTSENKDLPDWYKESPLVVTYPIRGRYDSDKMIPNAMFPYVNALPIIDDIKNKTDSRILVLLMHWEGTAPWAPPYVWPPYGGEQGFNDFLDELHQRGDLLGVYCSGFGYTIQSNLVAEYNKTKEFENDGLIEAMCAGPDEKVLLSRICNAQRSGYDICPCSKKGKKILEKAYTPLFDSGVDYAQILDQNHGGGQYFCYSRDHGHPIAPGKWMTESMKKMLSEWNKKAGSTLLGCESAAGEPFIGNLLFSDNRYELCYMIGRPVPLYAYIYHEYLRNFMGNQVSCPFLPDLDTLCYRIAYSFSIGDCMTLTLTPEGELMPYWGFPRYEKPQNKEKTLKLVKNLTRFYKEKAQPFLFNGRMLPCKGFECGSITYKKRKSSFTSTLPAIHATAWQAEDGRRAYILVNPEDKEANCSINGKQFIIPPLEAILIDY